MITGRDLWRVGLHFEFIPMGLNFFELLILCTEGTSCFCPCLFFAVFKAPHVETSTVLGEAIFVTGTSYFPPLFNQQYVNMDMKQKQILDIAK